MHQALTRLMRLHTLESVWFYKLLVCKSASERCVDQRKIMAPTYYAELARAEQLAELAGGHCYRTGLADARLSGGGQRVGERHRGVQRDIAFDLLQHLMDMSVQYGDSGI